MVLLLITEDGSRRQNPTGIIVGVILGLLAIIILGFVLYKITKYIQGNFSFGIICCYIVVLACSDKLTLLLVS